jgi:hypothetical protein
MEKIHHLEYILVLVNKQIAFAEQTFTTKEGTNNNSVELITTTEGNKNLVHRRNHDYKRC